MQHMWSFFYQKSVLSEKNGNIVVSSVFGKTDIFVGGFHQSSGYIQTMWRKALRHIRKSESIKTVLMLGLGGGSAVSELQKRFRGCAITVVEWDSEMIGLYLQIHPKNAPITVLEGDATIIVPQTVDVFDLVIVDLFKGNETPKDLGDHPMVRAIARCVAPEGYCILNAFVSLDLPQIFDEHFSQVERWIYKFNTLVLYRK